MNIPRARGIWNNEGRLFLKLDLYLNSHSLPLGLREFLAFVASAVHKRQE